MAPPLLSDFRKKFDLQLKDFLEQKFAENKKIDSSLASFLEEIKKNVLTGGKRIRPAFMFFAYCACGGKDEKALVKASCAVELLHHFALIHDDIMDNSPLRRSGPTLHQELGVSEAILAGDLLYAYAWEILSTASFPLAVLQKARKIFAQLSQEAIAGQYLDIKNSQKTFDKINFQNEEKRTLQILKFKSGKYSVERPCHLGAALAEASSKAFRVFSDYGLPLGVAFQIRDDILGMFSEEKILGKPIDSDLKEGKRTLLIIKTLQKLTKSGEEEAKRKFLSVWGNKEATIKDLAWVRKVVKETGSLKYSQDLSQKLAFQAKKAMITSSLDEESKKFFLEMADFLIERNY